MPRAYVFVDEWDVRAPIDAVFEALSDAGSYPGWWKPVYVAAKPLGDNVVEHLLKGRLPYRLRVRSQLVAKTRPRGSRPLCGEISPGEAYGRSPRVQTPSTFASIGR
jgi:hypothetical protein